jgi:membrane fusion protein, multidrug efflux system
MLSVTHPLPTRIMLPTLRPLPLLASATLLLLTACSDAPAPATAAQAPAVPVTVASITQTAATTPVSATGTFASRDEIPLGFKIGGVVQRVMIDAGATVQRGQILAALDLREIDAAVNKARVAVDKAQRDVARVQRLVYDSVATPVQLLDATSALDAAKADLASAQVNREFAIITAPEAGIVLTRLVNAGSTVAPGTPILTLGGSRRGRVLRVGLPDRDALRVALGDQATADFDALPGRRFTGRVVLVSRSADPRTGTYSVEIALNNTEALPNGLVGRAQIAVRERTMGHRIPMEALLEATGDSATVYTLSSGSAPVAQSMRVRIAQISGSDVAVEGISDSARVVVKGAAYVTPGARVRIVTDGAREAVPAKKGGMAP